MYQVPVIKSDTDLVYTLWSRMAAVQHKHTYKRDTACALDPVPIDVPNNFTTHPHPSRYFGNNSMFVNMPTHYTTIYYSQPSGSHTLSHTLFLWLPCTSSLLIHRR